MLLQMPRTGAYIMVRVAPSSSCNMTDAADAAGAAPGAFTAAAAADVDAAAAVDSSRVCVASMMAQEGEWCAHNSGC